MARPPWRIAPAPLCTIVPKLSRVPPLERSLSLGPATLIVPRFVTSPSPVSSTPPVHWNIVPGKSSVAPPIPAEIEPLSRATVPPPDPAYVPVKRLFSSGFVVKFIVAPWATTKVAPELVLFDPTQGINVPVSTSITPFAELFKIQMLAVALLVERLIVPELLIVAKTNGYSAVSLP